MFKVRDRSQPEEILTVYAVDYKENIGTFFFVYNEDVCDWEWVTADYYEPVVMLERRKR